MMTRNRVFFKSDVLPWGWWESSQILFGWIETSNLEGMNWWRTCHRQEADEFLGVGKVESSNKSWVVYGPMGQWWVTHICLPFPGSELESMIFRFSFFSGIYVIVPWRVMTWRFHVSNEKRALSCLGYRLGIILHSYMGIINLPL